MRLVVSLFAVAVVAGEAHAYTFGGFDADEGEYLKRGVDDVACAPAPDAACHAVDKRAARGYAKPARTRKLGADALAVTVEDEQRIKVAAGERVVGEWSPGGRVLAVNTNVFVSPGGALLAVEYEVAGKDGRQADVVAFRLGAAPEATPPPRAGLPPKAADPEGGKTAYARALAQGGVWEQRMVACDQAGVTLTLRKTRKFDIRIVTKCGGQKTATDLAGTFVTEGSDTLVLQFENEDGPLEKLECRLAACKEGPEDCLTCSQDDVTFTMQVVRR